MNTWTVNVASAILVAVISAPAFAASTSVQNDTAAQDRTSNTATTTMRQQLASDLTKAGFTDIKIMPESFLIRAKDSKGNPVMMVINPDSVTAMTQISAPASGSQKMAGSNANGEKVLSGSNANGDPTPPAKQ